MEKCLLCCEGGIGSLSPGNALRRVFECISAGILLSGNKDVSSVVSLMSLWCYILLVVHARNECPISCHIVSLNTVSSGS